MFNIVLGTVFNIKKTKFLKSSTHFFCQNSGKKLFKNLKKDKGQIRHQFI